MKQAKEGFAGHSTGLLLFIAATCRRDEFNSESPAIFKQGTGE